MHRSLLIQPNLKKNLYGRNISCEDGNASVMISPHTRKLGMVDVRGVYAKNCGFAVRIDKGFIAGKLSSVKGVTYGSFEPSIVEDVTAVYGTSAQLKSKHFKYIPCALRNIIKKVEANAEKVAIYNDPSAAALLNEVGGDEPGCYKMTVNQVKAIGFDAQPKSIITEVDAIEKCPE